MPKATTRLSSLTSSPTRERILAVAEDLYVLRGHEGFSFGDIAEAVETTRANIHHHFGNKRNLMAELIDRCAGDARRRIEEHWTKSRHSLSGRMGQQLGDLRRFYRRFNPRPGDRNVWSPVSRLRLDLPALGEPAIQALAEVNQAYKASLQQALLAAIHAGELVPGAPVDDISHLLRVTFLSCPPMTQDTGSFKDIEFLFAGVEGIILKAWGMIERSPVAHR